MNNLPEAESINYFKTSQTSSDVWIDKAIALIESFGGNVLAQGYGSEPNSGRAAFMLTFENDRQKYLIIFPVLPCKKGNERAARIQAATLLYHDVKAKLLLATVFGIRTAFFSYLQLPDGRSVIQATLPELQQGIPQIYLANNLLKE